MKFLAFFFVTFFAIGIEGFSDRMCGAKLSQIMWIVCENGFNTMLSKRNGHPNNILPNVDNDLSYPYKADPIAEIFQLERENFLAKTRRTRMSGIVDECCKKSCTLAELSAYCLT